MLCESFMVSPSRDDVERAAGSPICSYPQSAVEIPNEVFDDGSNHTEFTNIFSSATVDNRFLPRSNITRYIAILRGIDRTSDLVRIIKRVRDVDGPGEFSRSSLWLFIRVAIQMSLDRSSLGCAFYKQFLLFFMCSLAMDQNNSQLPSDLFQLVACKILRRLSKLGSSAPDWLSKMALETSSCLRDILDIRWNQLRDRTSPFQSPSQDALTRDTPLSLLDSRTYIRNALANPDHQCVIAPFNPSHRRRGTIGDFLSQSGTFFEEAYDADPHVTLYDLGQSVGGGIGDFLACVTNSEEACKQLGILMDKYITKAPMGKENCPETDSMIFLTAIELFVALDKLVLGEIPLLADYSPEIQIERPERLHLRQTGSLHRLSRAFQCLSRRHSQSCPGWSVFSDEFTQDSFPVRYFDQSLDHQCLKARIRQETMEKVSQHLGWQHESAGPSQSLPPMLSVHAKVIVFELQCPPCFFIWRLGLADGFRPMRWTTYSTAKSRTQIPST